MKATVLAESFILYFHRALSAMLISTDMSKEMSHSSLLFNIIDHNVDLNSPEKHRNMDIRKVGIKRMGELLL